MFLALESSTLFHITWHTRFMKLRHFHLFTQMPWCLVLLLLHCPLCKKQKHEDIDCEITESLRKLDPYFLTFSPHAILKTWNEYNQIVFSG